MRKVPCSSEGGNRILRVRLLEVRVSSDNSRTLTFVPVTLSALQQLDVHLFASGDGLRLAFFALTRIRMHSRKARIGVQFIQIERDRENMQAGGACKCVMHTHSRSRTTSRILYPPTG